LEKVNYSLRFMVGADPGEQAAEIRKRYRQANIRPWLAILAALAV
jgi:hypothetical protein